MVHPQVAIGLDDLHMWKVAVNILNKQPRTASNMAYSRVATGRYSLQI
jgi:hypothetical protein